MIILSNELVSGAQSCAKPRSRHDRAGGEASDSRMTQEAKQQKSKSASFPPPNPRQAMPPYRNPEREQATTSPHPYASTSALNATSKKSSAASQGIPGSIPVGSLSKLKAQLRQTRRLLQRVRLLLSAHFSTFFISQSFYSLRCMTKGGPHPGCQDHLRTTTQDPRARNRQSDSRRARTKDGDQVPRCQILWFVRPFFSIA